MLRFFKSLVFLAALSSTAPAWSEQLPVDTVIVLNRDGAHFRYKATLVAREKVALRGTNADTGQKMDLMLDRRGRVSGTIDDHMVDFIVPVAQRDAIVARLQRGEAMPLGTVIANTTITEASIR